MMISILRIIGFLVFIGGLISLCVISYILCTKEFEWSVRKVLDTATTVALCIFVTWAGICIFGSDLAKNKAIINYNNKDYTWIYNGEEITIKNIEDLNKLGKWYVTICDDTKEIIITNNRTRNIF